MSRVASLARRAALRWAAWRGGAGGEAPSVQGAILTYHSISPEPSSVAIHPELFRSQMERLARSSWKVLTVRELVERRGEEIPKMAVTFDDGFADFHRYALPILQELGLTATVYVVAGRVGGCSDWEKRASVSHAPLMGWSELEACMEAGVEIGAHTLDHPRLTRLAPAEIEHQLGEGRRLLSERLGQETVSFCYPYGDWDPQVAELVSRAGYRSAVTCDYRYLRSEDGVFLLPRLGINRVTATDHVAQRLYIDTILAGGAERYQTMKRARHSPVSGKEKA